MSSDSIKDARKRPFYTIDNDIIDIYGAKIGVYGIAVYNLIARHADAYGQNAFPSLTTITKKLGIGRSKATETIQLLVDAGLIHKENRTKDTGDATSNLYTLVDIVGSPQSGLPSPQPEPPVVLSEDHGSPQRGLYKDTNKKIPVKKSESARGDVPAQQPQQPPPSLPVQESYFGLPNQRHRQSRSVVAENMVEACELGLSKQAFTALSEAVADGCGKLPLYRAGRDQAIQDAQRTTLTLLRLDARFRTVEGVESVFKSWEANDFRGGSVPTFGQLEDHASLMVSGKVVCNRKDAPAAAPTPPPQPAVYQMPAAALAMKQRAEAAARGVTY